MQSSSSSYFHHFSNPLLSSPNSKMAFSFSANGSRIDIALNTIPFAQAFVPNQGPSTLVNVRLGHRSQVFSRDNHGVETLITQQYGPTSWAFISIPLDIVFAERYDLCFVQLWRKLLASGLGTDYELIESLAQHLASVLIFQKRQRALSGLLQANVTVVREYFIDHAMEIERELLADLYDSIERSMMELMLDMGEEEEEEDDDDDDDDEEDWDLALSLSESRGASAAALEKLKKERFNCQADENGERSTDTCVVCLEEFSGEELELIRLPCSHLFHEGCVLRWLKGRNSCPICRRQLQE